MGHCFVHLSEPANISFSYFRFYLSISFSSPLVSSFIWHLIFSVREPKRNELKSSLYLSIPDRQATQRHPFRLSLEYIIGKVRKHPRPLLFIPLPTSEHKELKVMACAVRFHIAPHLLSGFFKEGKWTDRMYENEKTYELYRLCSEKDVIVWTNYRVNEVHLHEARNRSRESWP